MQRYPISSTHRFVTPFQPAVHHHRRQLYRLLLVLFLVIEVLNSWSFAIPHAYAAGRPQSAPPSLTFAQFLKLGYVDKASHGPLLPRSVPPHVRSAAHPAHLANYSSPPSSFEPPTMKAISQPLASSLFVGSSGGSSLDLVGSDKRLEVIIAPGSLDLSHATVSGGTAPVGTLTLQLSQLQGHFLGQASQLGIYQLQVVDSKGQPVTGIVLHTPITVVYHYQPNELSSLNLDARKVLLSWPTLMKAARSPKQPTSSLLIPLHNDPARHTLSGQSTVFGPGPFTLSGPPANQSPPPSPMGSVQGNSGQFSYSYPLQVAPGSGGFAPQLALIYSSGGPNGRTTDSSPANNVGDGWSLSLGSISEADNPDGSQWYFLSGVDNVSDRLVQDSALTGGTFYQTEHISYLLIQQISSSITGKPCFAVWDKSGTYYQFGCTGDSLQSWYDGSTQHDYRWDLDKVIAPNENAGSFNIIQVSYLQDCVDASGQSASCSSTTTVRDAALEQISYGYSTPGSFHAAVRTYANTTLGTTVGQVDFAYYAPFSSTNSSGITVATKYPYGNGYTCTPKVSTSLRCDDPVTDGSEPAPTVMSTLSLQSITSYVGTDTTGNKAYGYQLGYHDSPITTTLPAPGGGTVTCEDPNTQAQEYCAGEHLLTSITPIVYQSGNAHQLPPVTFGYNDPVNAPLINTYYDTTNSLGGSNYAVETAWQ